MIETNPRNRGAPVQIRSMTAATRAILFIGSVLVFLAGVQLYLFSTETENFFAWTVSPPLGAAFFGAFYWTALVLAWLSSRETIWARARVGMGGILIFVTLTMVTTLMHLDKFHLDSPNPIARSAAWIWLLVYVLEPVALLAILAHQLRRPGIDPPRLHLLPAWFRIGTGIEAAILIPVGILLFLVPSTVDIAWPWTVGPLSARATGAWLLALAFVLVQSRFENDWARLRAATLSYAVMAMLQLVALVRFAGDVRWGSPAAIVYVLFLLGALVLGILGYLSARRASREGVPPAESSTLAA